MRRLSLFLLLMLALSASAQKRALSILGDSYSTFKDFVRPDTNFVWYPLSKGNFRLCQNNSFSGATICYTGYKQEDYSDRSFVTRVPYLGSPEVIIVFGGTNDSWAKSPVGEFKYENWTRQDLYSFRPAMACMLSLLQDYYPGAEIYVVINTELSKEVTESMQVISDHYGVRWILLHDIDKQWGHPSQKGMRQIAEQLSEVIK